MCTNDSNASQLELMLDQLDGQGAPEYRWARKLVHNAEDGSFTGAAQKLH